MERLVRFELTLSGWQPNVLPLNTIDAENWGEGRDSNPHVILLDTGATTQRGYLFRHLHHKNFMERVFRFELKPSAWKAEMLPLNTIPACYTLDKICT